MQYSTVRFLYFNLPDCCYFKFLPTEWSLTFAQKLVHVHKTIIYE